jgi:hypothetical protein
MLYVIKPNGEIHVKYSTLPTKNPLQGKSMAVIAVIRGKPKDGFHCRCSNKHIGNCGVTFKYNTTTVHNPPEADYCYGRSNNKPKNGYLRSNKYYS